MFQIQGQMAVYEVQWADVVALTTKGLSVERITFNETLCLEMLRKIHSFHLTSVIPEVEYNEYNITANLGL